jgi:hypothetical protein
MKSMKSIKRRIAKLEKQLLPPAETASSRELRKLLEAGRRRVEAYRIANGLPDPEEGLPPHKVHTTRGIQRIMDILHEGRDRAVLRTLRDKQLREGPSSGRSSDPADGISTAPDGIPLPAPQVVSKS